MKLVYVFFVLACSCNQISHEKTCLMPEKVEDPPKQYNQILDEVVVKKRIFSQGIHDVSSVSKSRKELTAFWVSSIGVEFFSEWNNTPWDYNGTTQQPGKGAIACGFFVTTVLRDMGVEINRTKMAICPSLEMMRKVCPDQAVRNLSSLSHPDFNAEISRMGKGVYIIGLDFHTGFIVNDGTENWFIHSNYINRRGVMKEPVISSSALRSSKTRWMVSLTGDDRFLYRWVKG